jgi:uncharacterized protein with PQ loop repeat
MVIGEALGLVAGGVSMLQGLPQARRVRTLGHGTGVSVSVWVLMMSANCLWIGYGLRIGAVAVIVSNVLTAIVSASVVIALRGEAARTAAGLFAYGTGLAVAGRVLPPKVIAALLVAFTLSRAPQLWRSIIAARSGERSAVSFGSLATTAASLVLWLTYSIVAHRPLVTVTSLLALALTTGIIAIELAARRNFSDPKVAIVSNHIG